MKKSLLRSEMFQEMSVPVNMTMPVRSAIIADMPSTPSESVIPRSPNGHGPGISSHCHARTNW